MLWLGGFKELFILEIFSETHFAVITHGPNGEFVHASGGPYSIDGDVATEYVRFGSSSDSMGHEKNGSELRCVLPLERSLFP